MNAAVLISASRARPAPPGQATRSSLPAATCRRQHPLRRGSLARAPRAAQSSDATCATSAAPLDVLLHACRTQQVAAEEVLAALQQVEASHAGQPQVQGFPASLNGRWRLVFAQPADKPALYIPIVEDLIIDVEGGSIVLEMPNKVFNGRCTVEQDPQAGIYRLHFGFASGEVAPEAAELTKFYSFFLLDDSLAAFTSSSGPKTLMIRV